MSQSKELMIASRPNFVTELLPSARRTALLYHLSYLCLAKFPRLERELRARAIETQLLFGSSEVLLLKCAATSKNLVSTLLPGLKAAVEKDKSVLAVKSLEKARTWITEIVEKVEQMVERYDKHNESVASYTSDVIAVKDETEQNIKKNVEEIAKLRKDVTKLKEQLKKITEEISQIDGRIAQKNQELQNNIKEAKKKRNRLGFFSALVPFVGPLINAIFGANIDAGLAANIQAISNELSRLSTEKSNLKNKEWEIQVKLTDLQLKLASFIMENESIPNPVHLNDVQTCLSRIQQILIQIKKFWETVSVMLEALRDETFAHEHFIEDSDMKEFFLDSITKAQQHWKDFGEACLLARDIFSLQKKNAYLFLEVSPSSLSPAEWKKRYNAVIVDLNKISPDPYAPNATAAIAQ